MRTMRPLAGVNNAHYYATLIPASIAASKLFTVLKLLIIIVGITRSLSYTIRLRVHRSAMKPKPQQRQRNGASGPHAVLLICRFLLA